MNVFLQGSGSKYTHTHLVMFGKERKTILLNVRVCVNWTCVFVFFPKMQIKSECLSCRHGVAVFDMSYFGKFYLTGPDAKKAADWLFTADVNKKPGRSAEASAHTCTLTHTNADTDGRED